jgi:tetratricopeptide (TPR) repeat protein
MRLGTRFADSDLQTSSDPFKMTQTGAKPRSARRKRGLPHVCEVTLTIAICAGAGAPISAERPIDEQLRDADVALATAVDQARGQFEAGQYVEVINTVNAHTASASNAEALMWVGRARLELRDYAAAIVDLERAVALAPNDSETHRWLGRAYGEEADRTRSFSLARRVRIQFEEAVRLAPTNVAAHRDLLEFHLEAPKIVGGRDRRAQQEVDALAALDPTAGRLARGAYLKHHDDAARAAAEYAAVLESMPANIDYVFEVADYYEDVGDTAGLQRAITVATGINASDSRVLYYRGVVEVMRRADVGGAESSLKAYLVVPPRSDRPSAVKTHEWLGRLYEHVGSRAKAIAEYARALALAPERKSVKEALRRLEPR